MNRANPFLAPRLPGQLPILCAVLGLQPAVEPSLHAAEATASVARPTVDLPILQEAELGTEVLWASDIQISETTLRYEQTGSAWEWSVAGFLNTFDEEYRPVRLFDPFGRATELQERTWGGQGTLGWKPDDRLVIAAGAGFYDGFDGYRSLWLDEYYRQQFSLVPGYQDADPWGVNVSGALTWEYWPANAIMETKLSYNRDEVAPGYEIETDPVTGAFAGLLRGRDDLNSLSFHVSTENVLHPRARSKLEFVATDTTDREWRLASQGSLNVAIGRNWVWRGQAGYTTEDPTFDAWFLGATLEYEPITAFYVYASGHYYHDTGEILNALQLSSAAPGLDAWNVGLGLRYVGNLATLKLFVGPYFTNYQPLEMGTAPFGKLYQDRSWWLAQLALNLQF